MRVKVLPIVVVMLGTIPERLEKGLEELEIREEIIETTALLRSVRIPERVKESLL